MTKLDNDLISRKALLEAICAEDVLKVYQCIKLVKQAPTIESEASSRADSGEAVAYLWESIGRWSAYLVSNGSKANLAPPDWLLDAVKNATSPKKQWVELTDEQILQAKSDCANSPYTNVHTALGFARAISAKLKEVNHG